MTRVREQTHTRTQSPSPAAHDGADPEHEGHEARRAANLRSRRHATHLQTTGGLEESVVWRTGSHALPSRLEHTVHHNAAGTHARAHACTEKQRLERHLCSRLQAASWIARAPEQKKNFSQQGMRRRQPPPCRDALPAPVPLCP